MAEKQSATRDAYGDALVRLALSEQFYVLDADLSKATKTSRFAAEFPHRFFDMGIAEADMMTTAAGLASCGIPVFASTFAVFAAGRAFEQIRNSIAYPKLNVKIAATHGGVLIGEDGASHQAIEDVALMRSLPNMTVVAPCDRISTYQLVKQALQWKGPVYLRFGRYESPELYREDAVLTLGKGQVLRTGTDVTVAAYGDMVAEACRAADLLRQEGIEAEVIDLHTIKPLDAELLQKSVQKTGRIVTAEDHNIIGGLGSAVSELLAEHEPAPMRRVGVKDRFGASGRKAELAQAYGLTAEAIVQACKELI